MPRLAASTSRQRTTARPRPLPATRSTESAMQMPNADCRMTIDGNRIASEGWHLQAQRHVSDAKLVGAPGNAPTTVPAVGLRVPPGEPHPRARTRGLGEAKVDSRRRQPPENGARTPAADVAGASLAPERPRRRNGRRARCWHGVPIPLRAREAPRSGVDGVSPSVASRPRPGVSHSGDTEAAHLPGARLAPTGTSPAGSRLHPRLPAAGPAGLDAPRRRPRRCDGGH